MAREFKPFEMFQSDWLTTDTSQFSHLLHILETKFMFDHVHVRYRILQYDWMTTYYFVYIMTDISDVIHFLNRIMFEHVHVRYRILQYD